MMQKIPDKHLQDLPIGRILSIDYGEKRIGIALSDPLQSLSTGLSTIQNKNRQLIVDEICRMADDNQVVAIVVGFPLNMNGRISKAALQVEELANQLREKIDLPLFLWDERWTTKSAHSLMHQLGKSPSRHKDKVDQIASAILLQSFLDRLERVRKENNARVCKIK